MNNSYAKLHVLQHLRVSTDPNINYIRSTVFDCKWNDVADMSHIYEPMNEPICKNESLGMF
jgi:hypothetical protein